jgi:uncharacterized coiled-coil protein SlyX
MPELPLASRVVELELMVTHLQRDVELLNGVILEQQREFESLRRMLTKLDDRVTRLGEEDDPRDPLSERPPHY